MKQEELINESLENKCSFSRTKIITNYYRNVIHSELWKNGVIYMKAMSVLVCMYTPGDLEKFEITNHSKNMYHYVSHVIETSKMTYVVRRTT